MKKVLRVLVIALALVGVLVVPALAGKGGKGRGARKAPFYDSTPWECAVGATDLSDGPYGFVIMNTNGNGHLIVQVSLKGGNVSTYNVAVHQNVSGSCSPTFFMGQLVTNGQGNGNAHVELARTPGATDFWVSLVETPGGNRYRTTSVQLE